MGKRNEKYLYHSLFNLLFVTRASEGEVTEEVQRLIHERSLIKKVY